MTDNGNFILYRASAGSGKTYTLVREFLTLSLSTENVIFNNILAVTFTNKAANEMKAKILNYLKEIITCDSSSSNMKADLIEATNLEESQIEKRAAKLYNNIIHNYSDLNVSTIDSFIQQVSRTFAREMNLPSQYKLLLDNNEFLDSLIQRIDKEIVAGHKNSSVEDDSKADGTLADTLIDYVEHKLQEENQWRLDSSIKKFITKLLKESAYKKGESYNVKSINTKEYQHINKYLGGKVAALKKTIKDNIENIEKFNGREGIEFDDYNSVLVTLYKKIKEDNNIAPKDLVKKTTISILSFEKKWNKGKKVWDDAINTELVGYYKNIVESNRALYLINIIWKDVYLYILRGSLLEIINNYMKETNEVHISEFNKRISDIIADCSVPFIYERIGSKYDHLFIDEFQDTSILQWFNFLPLVFNSLSNGNKTLLVGDAKQAIYRFRSGEVEQIIKLPEIHNKRMEMVGDTLRVASPFDEYESFFKDSYVEYELGTNHRSKKNVVVFNNSFFNYAKNYLPDDYKKVYEESKPQQYKEKTGDYDGCVNVKVFHLEKDESKYKDDVHRAMLHDIRSLETKIANFKYSDIAILVRNKDQGTEIAEYLSKNKIPVISSDSVMLRTSNKVLLIIFTLKYMMDEKNKVNKLNLAFYQNICRENSPKNDNSVDCYDLGGIMKCDVREDEIKALRSGTMSLYDLCAGIIKMYGFNVVDDVFLQYFMNMVQNWQNSENEGINAFLEYWDRKSGDLFIEISGDINAVQILTIHKSKGLEYKVVMYPFVHTCLPGGRFHSGEKWLEFKKDFELLKDMPILDSFILPISSSLTNTDMEMHYNEEYDKQAFDDFNIMYVAMTRAKDVLYLYTNDKEHTEKGNIFNAYFNNESGCLSIKNNELLKVKFDDLCAGENEDDAPVTDYREYQFGEPLYKPSVDKVDDNEIRLKDNEQVPELMDMSRYMILGEDKKEEEKESVKYGKLIHEIFSKINTVKDAEKVIRFYYNNGSISEAKSKEIMDLFMQISADEKIKEAYSENAVIRNEMEIKTESNVKKRPDRYAELEDKVILIDYKTGKSDAKHHKQLEEYAFVLRQMGIAKDIKPYLVYVGEKIEVKPAF